MANIQIMFLKNKLFIWEMGQNILNNNTRSIITRLYNANYYDYMLYKGGVANQTLEEVNDKLIVDFSSLYIVDGKLYSTATWSGATNDGVLLEDIGFTGIDNGLIKFRKDRVTNEEFLKILLESTYEIESGDTRLFLMPVTGNTLNYEYPIEIVENESEKYIAYKGGFHQGFFKLDGFDYEVLPYELPEDFTMHFEIRPRSDYEIDTYTVNYIHPENEGIFFFMGPRAENKFWPFYKTNDDIMLSLKKIDAQSEGYFSGCPESGQTEGIYNVNYNNVIHEEWVSEETESPEMPEPPAPPKYFVDDYFDEKGTREKGCAPAMDVIIKGLDNSYFIDDYFIEEEKPFIVAKEGLKFDISHLEDNTCGCGCDSKEGNWSEEELKCCIDCGGSGKNYFKDDYFDNECREDITKFVEDDYIGQDIEIDITGEEYTDTYGHGFTKRGYYEVRTDNKFITFNNTPDGYTTDTWPEDAEEVVYTYRQSWPNINYFLLMNQTPTGYTVDTIEQYNESHKKDFNIYKDIRNNAFCLRVTENGAIGYRYGIFTCDEEYPDHYKIVEEYSKDNIIKEDQWNNINVRFVRILSPKGKNSGIMKIMIYVNGFLVFISKELPAFNFRALDEVYQKQEGVPYNISLGGGTQGLLETIVPEYYAISDYILPMERDFCGSFMGDIKSFKIYDGFLTYSSICNYLGNDRERYTC